jgi:3-dehydroquinate synthase
MIMAADLSAREGLISLADYDRVVHIVHRASLPALPPVEMTPADFMSLMAVDKKNIDGRLRLVLLRSVGDAVVTSEASLENLTATLNAFCQQES